MVPVIGVGVAIAAKMGIVAWISTSPTAEGSRKSLLHHSKVILEKLEESDRLPAEKKASVLADIDALQPSVARGWTEPGEFWTASRLSNFILLSEMRCTAGGVTELVDNSLKVVIDSLFPPVPRDPDHIYT